MDELQNLTLEESLQNYREATRSASFNLSFGVRETRLLGNNLDPFRNRQVGSYSLGPQYTAQDLAALKRLITKGMVVIEHGRPELSPQGRLMRQQMIMSGHIVLRESEDSIDDTSVLGILRHALSWYRDNNSWLYGCRTETIDGEQRLVLTVRANSRRRDDRSTADQELAEWVITPQQLERIS